MATKTMMISAYVHTRTTDGDLPVVSKDFKLENLEILDDEVRIKFTMELVTLVQRIDHALRVQRAFNSIKSLTTELEKYQKEYTRLINDTKNEREI